MKSGYISPENAPSSSGILPPGTLGRDRLWQGGGVNRNSQTVLSRFFAVGVSVGVAVLAGSAWVAVGGASAALASPAPTFTPVTVTAPEVATAPPAGGGWWQDRDSGDVGSFAMTADAFDRSNAVKLNLPTTSAGINLHDVYATTARPTDLPALLSSASYTYTGANVNFQIEVAYQPNDVRYAPTGSSPCTSAANWGIAGVDSTWCYALLKWEPFATTSSWTAVDLSADTAGNSGSVPTKTAGWMSQKRVGSYPATSSRVGQTLSNYLAQMANYQVVSIGFGAGSGAAAPTASWVKNVTVGGESFSFAPVAAAPTPPPVANSTDLQTYITTNSIDVAATTATFSIGGGAAVSGLTSIDPAVAFDATLPWANTSETFVDVYAYSSPQLVGTFPVIAGVVQLTGVDLSALQAGSHHLVFIGQTSGAVSIVAIAIAAAAPTPDPAPTVTSTATSTSTLALTGTDAVGPTVGAISVLLLGLTMLILARTRSLTRRRVSGRE
jgi:hypothetical protein